jgi:hypothetical protein
MRVTVAQIDLRLARARAMATPRRGVIGTILLHRIEDTDPVFRRHPLVILAGGALLFYGLFAMIISAAEKVFG